MKSKLRSILASAGVALGLAAGLHAQESPALRVDIRSVTVVAVPSPVGGISVLGAGIGYESEPTVTLFGGFGSGATARAIVSGGSVREIIITSPGSGYISPPQVIIEGGGPADSTRPFTPATAASYLNGTNFNPPNESFGPALTPINVEARAVGTNVIESYTYNFYVNGVPMGESPIIGPPNSAVYPQFTPPRPGVYYFSVTATDGMTTVASPSVRYYATGTAITSPLTNTIVPQGSSVTIKADATTAQGFIQQIEFFLNGTTSLGVDSTAPYSVNYTPAHAPGSSVQITAVATDNNGTVLAPSDPITLNIVAAIGSPPTVSIASPLDGAVLPVPATGSTIPISVIANDSDGRIERVEVYVDGVLFDTDYTFPYSSSWAPTAVGRYLISALAYDDKNNVVTSPIHTINISAPPTVSVTFPTAGTTVSSGSPTILTANATDSDGVVTSVQFFADSTLIGTDNTAPYSVAWTPSGSGPVTLTAKATDNVGLSTVSAGVGVTVTGNGGGGDPPGVVIGNPPTTALTAPLSGTQHLVNNPIILLAEASDTDGNITSVQFYVGTTLISTDSVYPYTATWTPTSLGSYRLTTRATDNDGNVVTSAAVMITVGADAAPTVSLTSPTNGSFVTAGMPVILNANASDADGVVAGVSFVANGVLIGTDTEAPYSISWTPGAAGTYSLIAYATDNNGNVTGSTPVTVTAGATTAPTVQITQPVSGSSLRLGAGTTVRATASTPTGTIAGVQFFANGVLIGSGVTGTGGYTVNWVPTSAGIYRLTANATSSAGLVTSSDGVYVAVIDPDEGEIDTVYGGTSGLYLAGFETGRVALVRQGTRGATMIAFSTGGTATPQVYYYTGIDADSGGTLSLRNGNTTTVAGTISSASAFGTFNENKASFSAPLAFGVTSYRGPTGLVLGTISGKPNSQVTGIVGADGALTLYVQDGSANDAGQGTLLSSGAFDFTTAKGGRAQGKIDPSTGFLTLTLSDGPVTGSATGAFSAGTPASDGFLRNLSTRGMVSNGERVLIAGFYVTGSQPKQILVRGIGPSLAEFNVPSAIPDPAITVFNSGGAQVGYNNDWAGVAPVAAASAKVGAFPLAADSLDAALLVTLSPGAYSVHMTGINNAAGVGLFEVYDVDSLSPFSPQKLINLSSRGEVGTGDRVLIAGFYVSGTTPKRVLLRGIGPTLAQHGIASPLADPRLTLYQGQTIVRENDNWETGNAAAEVAAAAKSVGAFSLPAGSKDAVILITLPPGNYTAHVNGVNNSTGIALVEVYEVH